ncbi:MAG: EamA family transporter [Stappia sp.]|uniref:DMT family transporter n=1 Tax=Stappia sp. TaxID=1870903 RepID=UPI000C4DA4FB|nr:DMT family transporter [Stappia sp.]MAA99073.1 EamA family transporter [Stappia sp.]MBM18634.1 EamA family transporter [Stappia sp.]MBM22117.1 EamA family transporter [Stappia sp.]
MSRFAANSLLLLAALVWGSALVAQATAMDHLGPLTFTGLRFLIAAAVVLPFALAEGRRARARGTPGGHLTRNHYARFVLLGIVFFFGITVQQYGLLSTSVTNAGFLTAIYVVMTPIIAYLVFAERPHPIVWPASLTTLGGIWLLGGGSIASLGAGDLLMVVCAVFWAMHVCLIGRFAAASGRPFALSSCQFAVVGVIGLLPGLYLEPVSLATLAGAAPELLYTGIISGGIGFTLQAVGQRWTRSADAAILLSSEALFAAIFAALLLGERLTPAGLTGCLLIFAAILAVQLAPMIRLRRVRTEGI